jgi:hypothetical protein
VAEVVVEAEAVCKQMLMGSKKKKLSMIQTEEVEEATTEAILEAEAVCNQILMRIDLLLLNQEGEAEVEEGVAPQEEVME